MKLPVIEHNRQSWIDEYGCIFQRINSPNFIYSDGSQSWYKRPGPNHRLNYSKGYKYIHPILGNCHENHWD